MRRFITLLVAALALVVAAPFANAAPPQQKVTHVKLLAFNDFHGHLEATTPGRITDPATGASVSAGGAEYFSTWMKNLGANDPDTYVVSAGDLIGGSPLLSGLFHDEPTIEVMNQIGLDVNGVGNHEFDEGKNELLRVQYGPAAPDALPNGCHPVDGCQDGTPFAGSVFQFLAANVIDTDTHNPLLPEYKIVTTTNGTKVAFVGETLQGTPLIVTPTGVQGLEFLDEADTVNRLVPRLTSQGVRAIVLLLHQGGFQNGPFKDGFQNVNKCENFSGDDLLDVVNRLDPQVDVVVSAHTHAPYICDFNGRLVTSASSFGRLITTIRLSINRGGDVTAATAENRVVMQTVDKDPAITAILTHYKQFSDPIANRVVGTITADIRSSRAPDGFQSPSGEQEMGEVIADAQLAATAPSDFGGSVVAFMNPGGVRDDLLYNEISGGEQPGEVTYGELFAVQPFGNSLVVKTCTGAQIEALLEQQYAVNRTLLPSDSLRYSFSASAPVGAKVDPTSIKIDGVIVDPGASYRVTMNSFLADGGDGFSVFKECTQPLGGEVDVDAAGRYFEQNSPVSPPPLNRITRLP